MIRVIIADDVALFRDGIKTLIELDECFKVIGCARNGKEAVMLCDKLNPDIILMDIKMPEMDGIQATKLIKKKHNSIKILILTSFYEENDFEDAFKYADGYIFKDCEQNEFLSVLKNVARGMNVFDKSVLQRVRTNYITTKQTANNSNSTFKNFDLSKREIEVINRIVQGKKNKDIAKDLFISEGSVRNMISRVLDKLNLEDRTQLAIFAVTHDII